MNTGEDLWYQGGHISPDIDTVLYLFAGILNTKTWWGIEGDTFATHEYLTSLGEDTYLMVGDRDRAVQLLRGRLLREGMSLTRATEELSHRLAVRARVLPMTDHEYTSMIRTPEGLIHFQEYWVRYRGSVPLLEVVRVPAVAPAAGTELLEAIEASDLIIIGPSNPITSIAPILECRGIREALSRRRTVAISPFIGDQPVSGPARDLMIARGYEPDSSGVFGLYQDIVDIFVQDIRDPVTVPGALRCDTLMKTPDVAKELLRTILQEK